MIYRGLIPRFFNKYFGICLLLSADVYAVQLNQTLHDTVVHDRMTAQRMYDDICRVADREDMQNCTVVFVGNRDARLSFAAATGEVIGHSYYNFQMTETGVTNRVNALFNLYGMNLGGATGQDYQIALEASKGKKSWPSSESIFYVDDILVVKLSD